MTAYGPCEIQLNLGDGTQSCFQRRILITVLSRDLNPVVAHCLDDLVEPAKKADGL